MEIQDLAMHLARDMGRGIFVSSHAKTLILQACLLNAGLPHETNDVIRLGDMVDNLASQVWSDWLEAREEGQ